MLSEQLELLLVSVCFVCFVLEVGSQRTINLAPRTQQRANVAAQTTRLVNPLYTNGLFLLV